LRPVICMLAMSKYSKHLLPSTVSFTRERNDKRNPVVSLKPLRTHLILFRHCALSGLQRRKKFSHLLCVLQKTHPKELYLLSHERTGPPEVVPLGSRVSIGRADPETEKNGDLLFRTPFQISHCNPNQQSHRGSARSVLRPAFAISNPFVIIYRPCKIIYMKKTKKNVGCAEGLRRKGE